MHLHLTRMIFSPHATIGELRCGPELLCHVLEDVVRPAGAPKVWGQAAIPAGSYEVVVTYSQRFRQLLPLLIDVPGYEGIRIHPGNSAADTDGCLLVGHYDAHKPDWLANSRLTFAGLFARLRTALAQGQRLQLTIA